MIVGYTDRIIRVYGWLSANTNTNTNTNNANNTTNTSSNENSKASSATLNSSSYSFTSNESGKFILEQTWELPDQINSIHIFRDSLNIKHLFATQPGGHAFVCKTVQVADSLNNSNSSSTSSLSDLIQKSLVLSKEKQKTSNLTEEAINFFTEINPIEVERSTIHTYLVTNINFNKSNQYAYLITMNGDIFFFKMSLNNFNSNGSLKTPLWHRNINSLVLKYYKVDINVRTGEQIKFHTKNLTYFC